MAKKSTSAVETKEEVKAAPELPAAEPLQAAEPVVQQAAEIPQRREKILTKKSVPFRDAPNLTRKGVLGYSNADGSYVVLETIKNAFGKFYKLPGDRYVFAEADVVEV